MSDLPTRVINGAEARQVLENPAFKRAFTAIRESIISQMAQVKTRDTEMHTRLIDKLQAADAFERALKSFIETGRLAERDIEHKKTLAERAAAFAERVRGGISRN